MAKFTNKSPKAVFVPNPDYDPKAPPGSPLVISQRNIKVLPGQSVDDCPSDIAKDLTAEKLVSRTKAQQIAIFGNPKKPATGTTRGEE